MIIKWLGHSCFLLTTQAGLRIVTDPFDAKVGYPLPTVEADIVTVSHQHGDHNHVQALKGRFQVIDQAGEHTVQGVQIRGIPTFHDDVQGAKRGPNICFRISADGMTVLHCGDLGHTLSEEQLQAIGPVDILLLPVGGYFTIDASAARAVIDQIHPTLVIPMHFKNAAGAQGFPITTLDPFIELSPEAKQAGSQQVTLTPETLPQQSGVVVLEPPRA